MYEEEYDERYDKEPAKDLSPILKQRRRIKKKHKPDTFKVTKGRTYTLKYTYGPLYPGTMVKALTTVTTSTIYANIPFEVIEQVDGSGIRNRRWRDGHQCSGLCSTTDAGYFIDLNCINLNSNDADILLLL